MGDGKQRADDLWRAYQVGQGSADHTDREVFVEVVGSALRAAEGSPVDPEGVRHELTFSWGPSEDGSPDFVATHPTGYGTAADSAYLLRAVLSHEVRSELDRRGYDLRSIRFSIQAKEGHERFGLDAHEREDPR